MATFTLALHTPAKRKPSGRAEDVTERAAIQQALLTVVSRVSNAGAYSGEINHSGICGSFSYEVDGG